MSGAGDGDAQDGNGGPNPVVKLLQTVTPRPIRENFTLKFALVLILMALLIGALGLYGTSRITAETEDRVTEEFIEATVQNAQAVEEWVVSHEVSTRLISGDDIWGGNTPQPIEDMQAELNVQQQATGDDNHGLHIVQLSDGGPEVVASTSARTGTTLGDGDRPYLRDTTAIEGLAADEVYVSDLYTETGTPVVGFVSPTPAREDAYFVREVELSAISDTLGGNGDRMTRVVNESGMVVISGDVTEVPSPYADSDGAFRPVREARALRGDPEQSAGVITDMPGDPDVIDGTYTVGYAPVQLNDWVVLVHAPRSDEFGFADTLSTWGLLGTFGAVLVIGVIGAVMGYSTATSIDRLTAKTEEISEGNLDVPIHTTRVDNIGRLYGSFDRMRSQLKQQIQQAEDARKQAEVARTEAEEMSEYLRDRAEEYSLIMQDVGAGDLTQRMDPDGEEESMDRIAAEFNEMLDELEKTIGQLKDYVDEVEAAGAEVEGSADTVRDASEQIAESIQRISDDAYDQQETLADVVDATDATLADLEDIAAESEDPDLAAVVERLEENLDALNGVAELSEEMMGETQQVAGAAEEQAAELAEVSERANDLQRYAQPLRDILQEFETDQEHEFVFSIGPTGSEEGIGPGTEGQQGEE